MQKAVCDSSILIDHLRLQNKTNSVYSLILPKIYPVISLITVAELYSGKSVKNKGVKLEIDNMIDGCEIKIPDKKIAVAAGYLRMEYNLSIPDAFIAALSIDQNIQLATLDLNDFKKVKGLKLYPLK